MSRPTGLMLLRGMLLRGAFLLCVLLLGTVLSTRASADTTDDSVTRPNVLLILVDDLGYSDLGCYGSEIQTPRLDELAASGLRLTQFYNTGRCWPTRGALLSGFYPQSIRRDKIHGLNLGGGGNSKRPDWAILLPKMLAKAGYRSYHSGKWHIDGDAVDAGFDRSYTNQKSYFSPGPAKDSVTSWRPESPPEEFYLTTAMADHTIDCLDEHARLHGDRPFFQYLAFTAPHFPLHAKPEDIGVYRGRYDAGWDVIRKQRFERMRAAGLVDAIAAPSPNERDLGPPYYFPDAFEILGTGEVKRPLPWNQLTEQQQHFQAAKMEIHAAMIHRIDIEVGRVLDKIQSIGQLENTLVMFLSDNGASAEVMVRGDGHDPSAELGSALTYLCLGPGWSTVSNTPFRRHKTWTHEGGIATPLVASWPKRFQDRQRKNNGVEKDYVGHVIDVVPTVLEVAGITASPRDNHLPEFPGKSFASLLLGDDQAKPAPRTLWWNHDGHRAIRTGNFKAVAPIAEPWELYNLSNDRTEQHDLAIVRQTQLSKMVADWETINEGLVRLATADLSGKQITKAKQNQPPATFMKTAQDAARPKRRQVLLGGESFRVRDRHAFLMEPTEPSKDENRPWVFYAPALSRYPDEHESYLHSRLLDAGIAVAGVDVGEAYGSPQSHPFFEALYAEMKSRGYSDQPVLLGRSRGGLWVSSWAIANPDRVKAIAGIYPVFDFTTYPRISRAAPAYDMTAGELLAAKDQLNPVARANVLAENQIPIYIIHGEDDQVVPLKENSAAIEKAYEQAGVDDAITVQKIPGQGHDFWPGFFRCEELIDFVIEQSGP